MLNHEEKDIQGILRGQPAEEHQERTWKRNYQKISRESLEASQQNNTKKGSGEEATKHETRRVYDNAGNREIL